ncbi:MAG TPA: DUF1805 domain-containing protein [Candidatus Hydrogenedentes bacterium]|nr:DUF1805 domain-containing protein [Candidatus Hydrogenedentota bacterium]HNT88048.1 DUF1805 domain-containing protein [Candidatus Hydrogenedentota bacterium]
MIRVSPVPTEGAPALSLEVAWADGQFVLIVTDRGLVACGVVDKEVMDRFGAAIAIARGTPEHPLVTTDDLLNARIADVTGKAAALGVRAGMTGREALAILSS